MKCREDYITSEFTPTLGYICIWNLQSTCNRILPSIEYFDLAFQSAKVNGRKSRPLRFRSNSRSMYSEKYFSRAVCRLTCRGQNDIQITWDPMGEMSGKLRHFRIHSDLDTGCGRYSCAVYHSKKSCFLFRLGSFLIVSGEYDSIGSKCCKIKSTRHDFHSPISWKPQSPSCHLRRRDFLFNFRFVLHDENAWTKRRKWAGGFNGEYEIAAERNRRDRWTDAVRDVICYVTPLKCQFLGPRMETKKLQSRSERYGGAQAVAKVIAKSPCEWQKHFAPLSGRPKDPGLVTQEHRGAHPADIWPSQLS